MPCKSSPLTHWRPLASFSRFLSTGSEWRLVPMATAAVTQPALRARFSSQVQLSDTSDGKCAAFKQQHRDLCD